MHGGVISRKGSSSPVLSSRLLWEHPWPCCAAHPAGSAGAQPGDSSWHSCWDSEETLCDAEGAAAGTGAPAMAGGLGQGGVTLSTLSTEQSKKGSIRSGTH